MSFANEHAARQRDPASFEDGSFARSHPDGWPAGIDAILGHPKGSDSTEIQSIRADASKLSPGEFREWLRSHDFNATVEEATGDNGEKQQALDFNEPQLREIAGVEILATGTWNNTRFNERDLDDIVEAFKSAGFRVPLKQGHTKEKGAPALGWVENVRRAGNKLVADFKALPEKVFNAIKSRSFDAVSSEVFFDLKRDGRTFRRVLAGVALLGAEIPAVSNLKPLHELISLENEDHGGFVYMDYPGNTGDSDMATDKIKELEQKVEALEKEKAELEQKVEALEKEKAELEQASDKSEEPKDPKIVALEEQIADLRKRERAQRIEARAKEVKVPAFRPYAKALMELAEDRNGESGGKIELSEKGGKPEQVSPSALADRFIKFVNDMADRQLFNETAAGGDDDKADAPVDLSDSYKASEMLSQKIDEYLSENSDASEDDAIAAVLSQNPKLAEAYAG